MLDMPTTTLGTVPNDSDLYFETELRPLYSGVYRYGEREYHRAGKSVGVFRTDTDQYLGHHKENSYTLVDNKTFFGGIENALFHKFGDIPIKRKDLTSFNGARCTREWIFPTLTTELKAGSSVSTINFRSIGRNCFDGSSRCQIITGEIDEYCSNGMISGSYDTSSRKRTSGFDLTNLLSSVDHALEHYDSSVKVYQKWAESQIMVPYVKTFFESLKGVGERKADKFMDQYAKEAANRGQNLWAVVSALTAYASHSSERFPTRDTGNNHWNETLLTRQFEVQKWLSSQAFRHLEQHAALV